MEHLKRDGKNRMTKALESRIWNLKRQGVRVVNLALLTIWKTGSI